MPLIIAGFPGIGKTTLTSKKDLPFTVRDSDSSTFDKEDFPYNYVDHIETLYYEGEVDLILVSTHEDVRDELVDRGLFYTLVCPSTEDKAEYVKRYKERGSPEAFITLLENNFEQWVLACQEDDLSDEVIVLKSGEYLSHAVEDLRKRGFIP